MANRIDGSSLRRPLLIGALALSCLFGAVGGAVAWVGSERIAQSLRRSAATEQEDMTRADALESVRGVASDLRIRFDPARRAAEMVAGEAARCWDGAPPPAIAEDAFERLPGTTLRWHHEAGTESFSIAAASDAGEDAALVRFEERMASVLRAAADRRAGIARTAVTIDGVGLAGAPAAWARTVGLDAGLQSGVLSEMRPFDAPEGAQWLGADRGRLIFAVPVVRPDGRRVGTAWSEVATSSVCRWLDDLGTQSAVPALLSCTGATLATASTFASAVGAGPEPDGIAVALRPLVGGEGLFYPDDPGRHVVTEDRRLAAAGVVGTPFSAVVAGPAAAPPPADPAVADSVRKLGVAVFVLSLLFGAATLLLSAFVARHHGARVAPILRTIRSHERCNYSQSIEVPADDDLGEIARWINTAAIRLRHGVTRNEEAERRLANLIDASGDGFITTDADDRITDVNARFADLLRRAPGALVGRFVEELLLPESLDRYRAQFRRQREGRPARIELMWSAGRPPHPRTVAASVPLFDDEGRYSGSYVIVTDLTDKVRAHEEMARAEKIRALAEMAGGVAHDFNNVLTVILGNTQYLLLEDLPAEARETLRVVERTALEGTETVRRIREFTRSRTVPLNAAMFSLNDVAEAVMQAARKRFEEAGRARGVKYDVAVERRSRRRVRGNDAEMHEALSNVVENALDAMPKGGTLTVEVFDRGEDEVGVRVEDTGVGMTPEQLKKIYDPFFTTKQGGRCPGLGLSIAFGIVRAHRGRIDVRSQPAAGSTFTIVLPAARAEERPEPAAAAAPQVQPRVLLVGGDPAEMRQFVAELRELRVEAVNVQPTSCLALIVNSSIFNALVIDYELGDATGWELARQARASREDLRIVLLTTPAAPVSETQARNAGIDCVLVRPFDARDLHAEIFGLLAAPRERVATIEPASVRNRAHPAPRPREDDDLARTREIWAAGLVRPFEEDTGASEPDSQGVDATWTTDETAKDAAGTGGAEPPTGGQT